MDIFAGIALIAAAGLTAGGLFPNLDHAVDRSISQGGSLGAVDNIVDTSPWYYHADIPGRPQDAFHVMQFFGVALGLGGLLALVVAVFLLVGFGRRSRQIAVLGVAAAGLLLGAIVTTLINVVDDLQLDTYVPPGGHYTPGQHVTTFGLGFWLLAGAGVVTIGAMVLLLINPKRTEPPTPRYGIPVVTQLPAGNPPSQYPGPQHG